MNVPIIRPIVHQGDRHQAGYLSGKLALDRLTAAREGMGIALGPCLMAEANAGLARLLPEIELVGPEVWLLVHRELADLARVRVVLDVLAQCARADMGRFAGRTKLS